MHQALAALALCTLSGCSPLHFYCEPLMMTSELDGRINVTVSPDQADELNRRVIALLESEGFTYQSSASDDYLGPPDADGHLARFSNIRTIGCTSKNIVWFENVIRADEFLISVHHTALGSDNDSTRLTAGLLKAIRTSPSL